MDRCRVFNEQREFW